MCYDIIFFLKFEKVNIHFYKIIIKGTPDNIPNGTPHLEKNHKKHIKGHTY